MEPLETMAMRNKSIPNFTLSPINVNIADLGKVFQAHVDDAWCVNLKFKSKHNDRNRYRHIINAQTQKGDTDLLIKGV